MHPRFALTVGTLALLGSFPSLATDAIDADAIVVTATRQAMRTNELLSDVTSISTDEIEQAGASTTVAELLSRQPGIEMSRSGSQGSQTAIRIRGANSNQTILLIDGVRVGSATTGAATWSRIPLSEVERIEILRGPSSALYGNDAIGGVIQIFTRRGEGPARFYAEAGVGTQGTSSGALGISGAANNWRYSVHTTNVRTDGFSNVDNRSASNFNPDKDGFDSQATSASLSFAPSKGHELGITLLNSTGRNLYDSGYSPNAAAKDYQNQTDVSSYSIYSKNELSRAWRSTLRAGLSEDDSTEYTDNESTSIFRTRQNQFSWQNDFRLPVGNALLALERLDQRVDGTGGFTTSQRTIDSMLIGWNGNFGDHRLQFNARRDDNSQFGGKTTGNAAYGLQINDNMRAHVSYGTAYKAPTFNDLYYPLTNGYHGNPDLLPETAKNAEVALHYERGSHRASATYFVNKISNLISWSGHVSPVNIGNATLEGLTLAYQGQLGYYDVATSLDWLDARDDATGMILGRRARERANLSIGRRLGAFTGRAEIVAVSQRYDTDYDPSSPDRKVLGGYTLFNLYGSYALAKDWLLFARADNVFDKKYENAADYSTPGASFFVGLKYNQKP